MNLSRLKYILLSQVVFLPLVYIANLLTILAFQYINEYSNINYFIILSESIFLSAFIAILLSTSKKVVSRFLDDAFTLKYNFTLTSLYIVLHYLIFYLVDLGKISEEKQNFSIIYVSILLIILIYSNIKFKKLINDKKK